ncbi:MAG: DUF3098 domain-containing protein [Ferruginibacter sp.]|nr:DUF3098 domain-containing protein [Ferruginibacter sp.]
MATIKETEKKISKVENANNTLFNKQNYMWMLAGLVIMAIGFILMAGGKSADPKVFDDSDVNGFRRITLAPLLIVGGLIVEIFAIMKKPKDN